MTRKSLSVSFALLMMISACQSSPRVPAKDSNLVPYKYTLPGGASLDGLGILNGEHLIVDGDMVLPASAIVSSTRSTPRGNIYSSTWPQAIVRYAFDPAVTADVRQKVIAAMQPWKDIGIRILPVGRKIPSKYLTITTAYFPDTQWICAATIGYQTINNSPNTYWAGSGCTTHDYVHEWGHVLGLFHEHQRFDRDQFITANASIIGQVKSLTQQFGIYDFDSVMHYDAYRRDSNGLKIDAPPYYIVPKDGRSLNSFGFTEIPSYGDQQSILNLYPPPYGPIPN
jgi:hypothetical protein